MIIEDYTTTPPQGETRREERRSKRRFPIQQEARFRLPYGGSKVESGDAKTINISSSGVLIAGPSDLTASVPIELSIDWPALLNDVCPLKLWVSGTVVRSSVEGTVIAIERWEFRTRSRAFQQAVPAVA